MPIEIRELVIRATIEPDRKEAPSAQRAGLSTKEIVAECVQQVLEILRKKAER